MEKKQKKKGIFSTLGRWFRRTFFGSSKEYEDINVEEIVSPGKQVVRNFFGRKIAVFALIMLIFMLILSFIMPAFVPLDLNYTEVLQMNLAPGFNMMDVPDELANDVKTISSYSHFSVGLSNAGKVYVWGDTKLRAAGYDIADIPEAVQNNKILFAAAGYDHAIAIDENGNVYGWGNNRLGQYPGTIYEDRLANVNELLPDGKVDIDNVKSVQCGYQATAILMKDGSAICFGNSNGCLNMQMINRYDNIEDLTFTANYIVALLKDGNIAVGNVKGIYDTVNGDPKLKLSRYVGKRTITSVASTSATIAMIVVDEKAEAAATNDVERAAAHEVIFSGSFAYGENKMPTLPADEYFVQIEGGANHYTGLTNKGHLYAWGSNHLKQLNIDTDGENADRLIVTSFQNYAIDENNHLQAKWGHKGYIFGTDGKGADVFARCVHGGKMTMTIGAVAVVVSSIIAIIIGCISGYAGGWVDMLLMRITEIFSSIPFLPFAMILSAVLIRTSLTENQKIFIIMLILGVLSWTGLAKMIRAQILAEREKEFVTAAKAIGVRERRIAFKHILPNVMSVILVDLTLSFATCLLTESSLSYLGFGVQYPRPTWGNMLDAANDANVIKNYWWQWAFPALLLSVCTISINIIGDNLRDVLDPKSDRDK